MLREEKDFSFSPLQMKDERGDVDKQWQDVKPEKFEISMKSVRSYWH